MNEVLYEIEHELRLTHLGRVLVGWDMVEMDIETDWTVCASLDELEDGTQCKLEVYRQLAYHNDGGAEPVASTTGDPERCARWLEEWIKRTMTKYTKQDLYNACDTAQMLANRSQIPFAVCETQFGYLVNQHPLQAQHDKSLTILQTMDPVIAGPVGTDRQGRVVYGPPAFPEGDDIPHWPQTDDGFNRARDFGLKHGKGFPAHRVEHVVVDGGGQWFRVVVRPGGPPFNRYGKVSISTASVSRADVMDDLLLLAHDTLEAVSNGGAFLDLTEAAEQLALLVLAWDKAEH